MNHSKTIYRHKSMIQFQLNGYKPHITARVTQFSDSHLQQNDHYFHFHITTK